MKRFAITLWAVASILIFVVLPQAWATTLPLPPGAVRPIIPSIGDIPWVTPTLPAPGSSTPAPASPAPEEDRCAGIVARFPSSQAAQANFCCHTYLYPDRGEILELEGEESVSYDRLFFQCCLSDADASLTDAEKLACQCRVAPAAAMCQCQGAHQADFLNGCLRSVVPEGVPAPQFALDAEGTHYTLTLGRRAPVTLPVCTCASPQPFTATATCGGSPLDLMVYDYPCLYPAQASAVGAETVTEGYRVTARMDEESCARYSGTLREPAEGELIPLGEARPCTFVRPQCPCSTPPSEEAPSAQPTDAGSGDVPPSGSSLPENSLLKEPSPSAPEPASMTDTKKEGGCSLVIESGDPRR